MKKYPLSSIRGCLVSRALAGLGVLALLTGSVQHATAQTYTNSGTTSYVWSTSTTWNPSVPVSSSTTVLTFTGAPLSAEISTNDLGAFNLTTLNLSQTGTSAFTLASAAGSSLAFDGTTNLINSSNGSAAASITSAISFVNGLTINTSAFQGLTFTGVISGSGGLIKNNANGSITLNNNDNYTGGTTLNGGTVTFGATGAFGSGAITFNAGALATSLSNTTLTNAFFFGGNLSFTPQNTSTMTLSGPIDLTGGMRSLGVTAGDTLALSGAITDGGITKTATGKLVISNSGTNTYSGGTVISNGVLQFAKNSDIPVTGSILINNGGALEVNSSATAGDNNTITNWLNSGLIDTASQGTIAFKGGSSSENVDFSSTGYSGLFLGAAVNTTYTGSLTPSGGTYRLGGGGATLTLSVANTLSGSNSLIAGEALGLASLINAAGVPVQTSSGGTVSIGNANNMSGTTTVNSGILALSGTGGAHGSLANSDITVNNVGTLAIDTGTGTITRANSVTLNTGAIFTVTGTTVATNDVITNAITANEGISTITLTGTKTELSAGSLVRSPGAVLLVRGAAYGTGAIGGGTSSNIFLASAPTLSGSGAVGTTTVGVLPWGIGSATSATSTGTDFLTYDAVNGLRTLTGTEEITTFANGNATADNAKISTSITGINSATLLNSLVLTASGSVEGTGVLTIASGGILSTGASDIGGVSAGTLAFGANEAIITTTLSGAALKIGNVVTGSGGLTKNGAGTLNLSNAANTYTGVTTLNAGTTQVSKLANGLANSSLGASSNSAANLVIDGGILQYTGTTAASTDRLFTIGLNGAGITNSGTSSLSFTNTGTLGLQGSGARVLTLGGNPAMGFSTVNTLAAVIGDNGGPTSVYKTNPGGAGSSTWVLSGLNTYTGTTYIFGDANNTGGTLSVSVLANGGTASGIGASTSDASNLVINRGSLQYTGSGASTDRLFTIGASGGTLDASGTGAINYTNTGTIVMAGTGVRTLTLTGTNTGNNTLAAVIGDAGANSAADALGLAKSGAGTWVLTGVNTFTGNTSITAGTLVIGGTGQLGAGSYAGTIAISTSSTLTDASSANQILSGVISGAGNVTSTSTGSLTLSGSNTYSGGTTISVGTLVLGSSTTVTSGAITSGPLGKGNLLLGNGTSLDDNGGTITIANNVSMSGNITFGSTGGGSLIFDGTTLTTPAVITLLGNTTLTVNNNTTIVDNISNTNNFNFNKVGAGTLTLAGTTTSTAGTTVTDGTLSIAKSNSIGSGLISLADGTALQYTGATGTITQAITAASGGTSTLVNTGGSIVTLSGTLTKAHSNLVFGGGSFDVRGNITGGTTSDFNSDLIVNNGSSVQLDGTNNYTGNTYIYGGGSILDGAGTMPAGTVLNIGDASDGAVTNIFNLNGDNQTVAAINTTSTGTNTNIILNGGAGSGTATLTISGTNSAGTQVSSSFAGSIQDGGTTKTAVAITGGTHTFSGASTYTGGTTVSNGTLVVGNTTGSATGNGVFVLSSTGTLAGAGAINSTTNTINGAVQVGFNGTPNTTGSLTLTATGTTTFAGASLTFNLNGATAGESNMINVGSTGNVFFGAGANLTLNLLDTTATIDQTLYTLFKTTATGSGTLASQSMFGGSGFTWDTTTGRISGLNFTIENSTSPVGFYNNSYLVFVNNGSGAFNIDLQVVPEPGTWVLMLGGLALLVAYQRVRRSKNV